MRFFSREGADNPGQRLAGSDEFHFHGRHGAALKGGDFRDRMIANVEELEEGALRRRQAVEGSMKEAGAAVAIEIGFEGRHVGDESLVDVGQIFGRRSAAPPVIAHRVMDDLHQQRARMCDLLDALKRFERVKRDILLQVFIVKGRARPLRHDVNEASNFCRTKIHVTVFLDARLYQA
jgi:hypothetical protein